LAGDLKARRGGLAGRRRGRVSIVHGDVGGGVLEEMGILAALDAVETLGDGGFFEAAEVSAVELGAIAGRERCHQLL